jgi:hypothetical protein
VEGIDVARFKNQVAALCLVDDETDEPLASDKIDEQLTYCKELGYVNEDESSHRLFASQRVNGERFFLEYIAEQAKTFASATEASSMEGNPMPKKRAHGVINKKRVARSEKPIRRAEPASGAS